jgi:hypothetical protein
LKKGNEESKIFELEGEMMFDNNIELGESYNNSPERQQDISGETKNDYSVMLKSMLAKAKKQK